MTRLQQILAAIVAVQVILAAVVFWPTQAAATGGAPLVAGFDAAKVTALAIDDADKNHIKIQKQGEAWVLASAGDYPVKTEKVDEVLTKLGGIKTSRLVTRTESSHKRLQVAADDFQRRLVVTLEGGKTATLYLGSAPATKATHVRLDGDAAVYLTSEVTGWEVNATANSWVDTIYVNPAQDSLTSVVVENASGKLELENSNGQWQVKGASGPVDAAKVAALVKKLSPLSMVAPLGKESKAEYGLDKPAATVTATEKDGKTITVTFGAKDSNENYYAKASSSDYYVTISGYNAGEFVNKKLEDLLQQPTPTPAAP